MSTYDLKFNPLVVNLHGLIVELDTDGTDEAISVGIVHETTEQVAFSNARVPNEQQFEQVVARG